MKTYISRREKNDQLVIMYGGWGTDESIFTPLCNDEFDYILFYNYSADEALVLPETKTYKKITLVGWSLGVWAAEYLFPGTGIVADVTIAVNGTPEPADDRYGIPLKVFEGTLNNITEENMEKFYLRMFGDKRNYNLNRDIIPYRTLKSLHDELRWLYNRIMEPRKAGFRWDYAVTSDVDRVFPGDNVKAFWEKQEQTRHLILPLPHYLFYNWSTYSEFIRFVENHKRKRKKKQQVTG
jgi:biotin synthesis protein BioG